VLKAAGLVTMGHEYMGYRAEGLCSCFVSTIVCLFSMCMYCVLYCMYCMYCVLCVLYVLYVQYYVQECLVIMERDMDCKARNTQQLCEVEGIPSCIVLLL
jgi:hypothetical protein